MAGLKSNGVDHLQSAEQRKILDTISQLRKCQLEGELSLPQIVVCGDQSAGKSSVLEALTGISFPRSDNLCTRFATELIMRHAEYESVTISILPDPDRPSEESQHLSEFRSVLETFDDVPTLIDKAKTAMGISPNPTSLDQSARPFRSFSQDILRIEIEGPGRPHLTLVDLPGLIQNESEGVSREDISLVQILTERYLREPRTICLAVITATNDFANQGILTKIRDADPTGERSMGLLTKPDRLESGSGAEANYVRLIIDGSSQYPFKLGWHVLRNRSFEESDSSLESRSQKERSFFTQSAFCVVPANNRGVDSLRKKLSDILLQHIKRELPKLRKETSQRIRTARATIKELGRSRSSVKECREYLVDLSTKMHKLITDACAANYYDRFFHGRLGNDKIAPRRVRARIEDAKDEFADIMQQKGHRYTVTVSDECADDVAMDSLEERMNSVDMESDDMSEYGESNFTTFYQPLELRHEDAVQLARAGIASSRSLMPRSHFDPRVISELFWNQKRPWRALSTEYLERVHRLCAEVLRDMLQYLCVPDLEVQLWESLFVGPLEKRRDDALDVLQDHLLALDLPQSNYNSQYGIKAQQKKAVRDATRLLAAVKAATSTKTFRSKDGSEEFKIPQTDPQMVVKQFFATDSAGMHENRTAEDALDCMQTLYEVKMGEFTELVTNHLVEYHMIKGLEDIFSAAVVTGLSDEAVQNLASEPPNLTQERTSTIARLESLEAGQKILGSVIGLEMVA